MFKAIGLTAEMHRESWFMCGFHVFHEELNVQWLPEPDTFYLFYFL